MRDKFELCRLNPVTAKCWKCLSIHVKANLNFIVRFEAIIKTTVVSTATFTQKPGEHWQINTTSYFRPQLEKRKQKIKSEIISSATRGQPPFTAVWKSGQNSKTDPQCSHPRVLHIWLKITVQFNKGITCTPSG